MLRRRTVAAGAALVALAGLLGTAPAQAGGTYVICPSGVNAFVWDGGGDGTSWNDAGNWDVNCTPGLLNQPHDDVVTIPAGADVWIEDGESAYVMALHNAGSLTITPGGVLKTIANSESETTLLQGLLFGTGRFTVTGTMTWQSTAFGGATMSTRRCAKEDCSQAPPAPGTTVVAVGALLKIDGRGVNLSDRRVLENHGRVRLSGNGYVAADWGTGFSNVRLAGDPRPVFAIANDLGYFQGLLNTGPTASTFWNSGRVVKAAGSGTAVIDAQYESSHPDSQAVGDLVVQSGALSTLSPNAIGLVKARVDQGSGFGNGSPGSCLTFVQVDPDTPPLPDSSACSGVDLDGNDQQAVSVSLTEPGASSTSVVIEELTAGVNPGGFGVPVRIEAPNGQGTTSDPMVFRLYVDSSLLGSDAPGDVAQLAKVQRKASAAAKYKALPNCAVTGGATSTQACVNRADSVTETNAAGGDVVIVVETLQNSRYRVGRIPSAT